MFNSGICKLQGLGVYIISVTYSILPGLIFLQIYYTYKEKMVLMFV